jgi:uncharacterized protein (DUF697 family)
MMTNGQFEDDPTGFRPASNVKGMQHEAREATFKYAAVAGLIAGLIGLQPLPGISRLILPFIEARLVKRISEIYGQPLSAIYYLTVFIMLFFVGGVIGTVIDSLLIPFIGVGAIPKALIAAGIVYGIGEFTIHYFAAHLNRD